MTPMTTLRASWLRFSNALRLVLAVQWKTGFPVVYVILAFVTVAALRLTPLVDYRELLLPALQLGEYGTLALLMVAAHRYLTINEKSEVALVVTPLRSGEYVMALALGSSLVPTAVGIGVQALALAPSWGLVWLAPPLLLTATFCGLAGVALSARHREFTSYLLGSFIPAMALLSLPFFSYFKVVPRAMLAWVPTDAGLAGFANSIATRPSLATLALSVGALLFWNAIALRAAANGFDRSVRASVS